MSIAYADNSNASGWKQPFIVEPSHFKIDIQATKHMESSHNAMMHEDYVKLIGEQINRLREAG